MQGPNNGEQTENYKINIEYADKPNQPEGKLFVKVLTDGEEKYESANTFPKVINRGHINDCKYVDEKVTNIKGIKIHRENGNVKSGCHIDRVIVKNVKTGDVTVFPVYTNITSDRAYTFMTNDLSLPQYSPRKDERKTDVDEKGKIYSLDDSLQGCPPRVKVLPDAEKLSIVLEFHLGLKLLLNKARVPKDTTIPFNTVEEIRNVFRTSFKEPSNLDRWKNDVLFGMQRLMGVNPVMIRLCKDIPEKLDLNWSMVDFILQKMQQKNKTLSEAKQNDRIFIIDYAILDGIPTKAEFVMTAPIALFYQRDDGKLVPIAIQLFQKPSRVNPVFLPSDPENTWILAKMWFNVADANYHQSVTHLGFTHLKMEGIVVCTHRQIHKDHPIFALLMPHFLYLLAINYSGIPILLGENGFVPNLLNIGSEGMLELIKRKNETWRMDIDGTLPADLKDRGVDAPNLLPDYYYREDAKDLFEAILRYVTKYLDLYYASDDDVQEDHELQNWRNEMVAPVNGHGLGMLGVFGENDKKFTNKEQVCRTLTSIIFTCSVQHAAANFRQYEEYGYPPNYPLCLRGNPPTTNDPIDREDLLQYLPEMKATYDTLAITDVLSTNDTFALGVFEIQYIHDERALEVVRQFRRELAYISEKIEKKNENERTIEKYDCLNPMKVPNSISI